MHRMKNNMISNIAAKIWSMVSVYLFIPLYIGVLGETSYGLVSFFATLQTALGLLGLGLSNTLRREFAVDEDSDNNSIRKYKLLRSIEFVYYIIGLVIICICCLGANVIAKKWLNIESLDPQMVSAVISLMGISIAFQLIANLYAGCLFGLEYQVLANIFCIAWSFFKSVGALAVIYYIAPNLVYFYLWHIVTDLVYLIVLRYSVIKKLQLKERRWVIKELKNIKTIWKYTCGILLISFIGLMNRQLDKVIISKFLTLTELGSYNVATTLGSLCAVIPMAIHTTVFPRFTRYATNKEEENLKKEFLLFNRCVNIFLSSMAAFISVYSPVLIKIWTRSDIYVNILGKTGAIVVLAVALAEFQELPYALALANGNTKYNVLVGGVFIPFEVIVTYWGIWKYGLMGAGVVYLCIMFLQTIWYEYLIYKRYIAKKPFEMILRDTIVPLVLSIIIAYGSKAIIGGMMLSNIVLAIYAVAFGIITLLLLSAILAGHELRLFWGKLMVRKTVER